MGKHQAIFSKNAHEKIGCFKYIIGIYMHCMNGYRMLDVQFSGPKDKSYN